MYLNYCALIIVTIFLIPNFFSSLDFFSVHITDDYLNLLLLWFIFGFFFPFLQNSTKNLHQINTMRYLYDVGFIFVVFFFQCIQFLQIYFAERVQKTATNEKKMKRNDYEIVKEFGFVCFVYAVLYLYYSLITHLNPSKRRKKRKNECTPVCECIVKCARATAV